MINFVAFPVLPKWMVTSLVAASFAVSINVKPTISLGVYDGILNECLPARITCISSQDDAPVSFLEPWQYDVDNNGTSSSSRTNIENKLKLIILSLPGSSLVEEEDFDGMYMRFEIKVPPFGIDDVELYFPTDDNVVHFRSEVRGGVRFDGWRNRNRMNDIRIKAGLEAIPVLRGRSSILGVFESPFDEFGPTAADVDAIIERGGVSSRPSR